MKAIEVRQPGGPEVLKLQEVEIGKPEKGKALIRLAAAGVNFVDIYQRRGTYPRKPPFIPGMEGAGTVEAVGEGVSSFKPGDRVAYVHDGSGSYAEESLVKVDKLDPFAARFFF